MQHAIDLTVGLILGLFHVIVTAIASIEGILRATLIPLGIGPAGQNIVLLVVALALIVGAIRFFGGIFTILVTVVLVLLMLHVLMPALGGS